MLFLKQYKRAFEILKKKPLLLWGLSLLNALMTSIACVVTAPLAILGAAATFLLSCGMIKVYLDFLAGKEVNSDQLFSAFTKNPVRIVGGMAWMTLWVVIWGLIPVAGPVLAIVKYNAYKYVPYILMTKPDVTATQALRLSMDMTKGKRLQLFLSDLCFAAAIVAVNIVFGIIISVITLIATATGVEAIIVIASLITVLLGLVMWAVNVVIAALSPVFVGLYSAGFYFDEETAEAVEEVPATV